MMMEDEFKKIHAKGLRKRCFHFFISELVRIAEIFEKTSYHRSSERKEKNGKNRSDGNPKTAGDFLKPKRKRSERPLPFCLYGECQSNGIYHLLKDCPHVKDKSQQQLKLIEERRKKNG
eukprot:gb/GEZJ01005407.1/.p1 GENE.gb/GEZJ01005407.1/~~gb/GEZJ01005407.1/.p1  ORF type:complete len:119 (+),score=19.76 gb/GEZJ01005407.1/:508-864(+)